MNVRSVSFLCAIALLGVGCGEAPAAATSLPGDTSALLVTRGDFVDLLYLTGEVESAGGETIVVPRIPNWQTSIKTLVKDGTRVEAGEVVAELDSTQFSSGLEQRKQGLLDAVQSIAQQVARNEAELAQHEFDLEEKRVELEKSRTKAKIPKDIVALREWEDSQLALKRAEVAWEKTQNDYESQKKAGEAEVANLRLTRAGAERDIRLATEAIEALTLRAASSGVVVIGENRNTGRKFQTGDTVWVGMKLVSIPDLSSLRVSATLMDVDDGRVEVGMPVEVVVDAFPERRFEGVISDIGTVADTLTRTSLRRGFSLTVALDDADRELLRPGYSVRAAVTRSEVQDALLVPRAGVDFAEGAPILRHRNGSIIDGVSIGGCNAQMCLVSSGLEPGDRVAPAGGAGS